LEELVKRAVELGFSHSGVLDATALELKSEVRAMCGADKCRNYGRSWTCPPACLSLEDNEKILSRYRSGILVQTTGELEDDFDWEGMTAAGERQKELFRAFRDELSPEYPDIMALAHGPCGLCGECSYPGAPCRHPESALTSMEAFGLLVSDACSKNGLPYYYGPRTITYTGCFLLM
jgi:predicted metal-binding protein